MFNASYTAAGADPQGRWTAAAPVACRTAEGVVFGELQLSERGERHAGLRKRCDDLEAAYEARGLVMTAIGHDLRQPAQAIGLVLSRLEARAIDESDRALLRAAGREAARLTRGLDSLAIAVRDKGDRPERPALGPTSLGPLLSDAAETWAPIAKAKGLTLSAIDTDIRVASNARLLSVILDNLVSNAVKYTDTGGVVIACRHLGDLVDVEVSDTGRGFGLAAADALKPFARAAMDGNGLGLGLSIAERAATLLGHGLLIRSAGDRGSIVAIRAACA